MTIVSKLSTDQLTGAALTEPQLRQMVSFAAKMANIATDFDRYQWLAIKAALEAMLSQAAGGTLSSATASPGEPARGRPARRQPQPAKAV